ncbi:uncharacterized protein LOC128897145 isoform X2 [Hylaeus anthracinus]|uniref:uncharacterized protein LOC128897145 isoform X2 n=1 Tax=Hylaeus anthracinus TaxID=313031 RepID=UPI0023BA0D54|nr:uncharacterized protein LOC128897145 isoform X2 [Hylaeus anthracinus]
MRQGEHTPTGLIDHIHLTMRNIRGSASYWRRCCPELIVMVRSLGPPTWFATFSCNDLNWPDMLKAFLISEGRSSEEAGNITFTDRLKLVQRYPVVVARQFTREPAFALADLVCKHTGFPKQRRGQCYRECCIVLNRNRGTRYR